MLSLTTTTLRAVLVGCGRPQSMAADGKHGFAIAYAHGEGYLRSEVVQLTAAVDIDPANLERFADTFGVAGRYTSFTEMLKNERPDIVSICTWPRLHKEMVIEAAQAGVKGILCEKPMAISYADALEMHSVCKRHGAVLNVNHQRRFDYRFRKAKEMLLREEIGKPLRMETWIGDGWDLLSWGTHWVDILRYFNNDEPVDHLFAQADPTKRQIRYQHPVEDRILIQLKFHSGVLGLLHISEDPVQPGILLSGDEGMILFHPESNQPVTVVNRNGISKLDRPQDAPNPFQKAIEALADSVRTGKMSELDSSSSLINMQISMAAYESARMHTTIRFPYESPENPLERWFSEEEE